MNFEDLEIVGTLEDPIVDKVRGQLRDLARYRGDDLRGILVEGVEWSRLRPVVESMSREKQRVRALALKVIERSPTSFLVRVRATVGAS